ncbi:MAG: PEGA domain-containing protein [Byssovorax sp.]
MKRRLLGLVLAGVMALRPTPALAQTALDQARIYFDAGVQAYSAGRYAAAVEAFTDAYGLAPKPTVLFSLAQAERRQFTVARDPHLLHDSASHFRKYLDEIPEGGRRPDAVEALVELEVMGGHLDAAALAGASNAAPQVAPQARLIVSTAIKEAVISVDGIDHQELPVIQTLSAGKHLVHASAPGYLDEEKEITAVQGLVIPLEFVLRERPAYLDIRAMAGALITVDGHREGPAPLGAAIDIAPGSHLVVLTKTGFYPYVGTVTIERGQTIPLRVVLRRTQQRTLAEVALGAGAAATLGAVIFGVAAAVKEETASEVLGITKFGNISQTQLDGYNTALASRDRLRTASFALVGASAALGLAGASLYLLDDPVPGDPRRRGERIAPRPLAVVVRPGAATIGIRGEF